MNVFILKYFLICLIYNLKKRNFLCFLLSNFPPDNFSVQILCLGTPNLIRSLCGSHWLAINLTKGKSCPQFVRSFTTVTTRFGELGLQYRPDSQFVTIAKSVRFAWIGRKNRFDDREEPHLDRHSFTLRGPISPALHSNFEPVVCQNCIQLDLNQFRFDSPGFAQNQFFATLLVFLVIHAKICLNLWSLPWKWPK